ncbi:hypothetical protein [Streptomyces lanatus]|uniref:Membrane-bound hydrophilic protein n=1 Tax=Streptomyces lanatus TaxID=66900 RepID=A0ABV1XL27_9ACTN|nr:hypothetical protein [Streptomyces lanatus]GHG97913.1 hypothetical protein GCM10018780_23620 [Streptomyces lanatus]
MSADEAIDNNPLAPARKRTGPRHAAPKKPLFTRFQVPAGKAIAMAAMPTAVLMGMGFTPTLALADDAKSPTPSNSLTADEYKDCVAALADDPSGSPSPEASESKDEDETEEPTPSPSATSGNSSDSSGSSDSAGDSASSDSGSDDAPEPTPSPSASKSSEEQSSDTATASPSPSESGGNLLEDIGDAISGIFTGGNKDTASPSPTPSASASESADEEASSESDAKDPVKDTTDKVTDTVEGTVKDTTDKATEAAKDTTEAAEKAAEEAADEATASPSPSPSESTDPENCPAATDDEGGVDNKILVPDDPWYLEASSLLLKGADYQGIVEVKTASGKTKKVLKYVISDGTDIGDLHQIVKDKQSGKTHHVQAAKGSTSTIRDGKTVMYTESISGNLLGLIPITFDPEHPPPLNIPLIYFTKVKVTQAGQFGGTLTVPGMHTTITD